MGEVVGKRGVDAVFAPRSVVVVGASADPTKRGHQILRGLLNGDFEGAVYGVNPRGGRILGHRLHESIEALPEAPDLAVVCTPASSTPDVVESCGRRGVAGAVILAVGFRESGPDGAALENRLRDSARRFGVRLVGPNTSGILNLPLGLNLIGVPGAAEGAISLLVQSGNVALGLIREASRREGPGISMCVGLGNEVDVGFGEALSWLGEHPPTRAVVCYAEGIRAPRAFLEAAAAITPYKPVVLLAAGRSPQGAEAARSHTGAVAAPYDRFRAGLLQAGVVPVDRADELMPVAQALGGQPHASPGTGVAVLSDGGGHGTLVADHLSELGVELAVPSPETRAALTALLGPASALGNPFDLAGAADADPRVFASALKILLADPQVGGVLMVGLFGGYAARFDEGLLGREIEAARTTARIAGESGKPLVVHSLYEPDGGEPLAVLKRAGFPVSVSLEVACRCIAELWRRGSLLEEPSWRPTGTVGLDRGGGDPGAAASPLPEPIVLQRARSERRESLTEPEARDLLSARGVPLPPAALCVSPDEAAAAWASFSRPVALKVVSTGIPHKVDAGGVALGVNGVEAVREAFDTVVRRARRHLESLGSRFGVEGVLVTPMQPPPLVELLVGVSREGGMGPVLTVGSGGTWVEWIRDIGHRVLPVDERNVRRLLDDLRVGSILRGARGGSSGDVDGIVAVAMALGRVALDLPGIAEIEINPLFVYEDRVVPVDVRLFLDSSRATPSGGSTPPSHPR
jgi:acetyltransferase